MDSCRTGGGLRMTGGRRLIEHGMQIEGAKRVAEGGICDGVACAGRRGHFCIARSS